MASSSSSSLNWSYDVFPSFSREDVRKTFLSHFLKELDRKLIIAFKDNEIERSHSIGPELIQAIRDSRISVVVFSKQYASSSWCLNELLEIVKCKEDLGQLVIPIFYCLDPSHVRKQTGEFGNIFEKTCLNKTEDEKNRWRGALNDVANIVGYHSTTCDEAMMIEAIANDLLGKLILTPSKDFEDFVGIEDHIAKMSLLLNLESNEARMIGIWGPSGIGKTIIARTLFRRLSRLFQSSVFIDRIFISRSMQGYSRSNLVDYNMKLHLQRTFLAEILDKKDIRIDDISAIEKMLKHRKTLIFIDDLDDQDVLDALAGQLMWFGSGSRILVVTNNMHFLRAHGIHHIYEVSLPSKDLALKMFSQYAFKKDSPPDGFMELSLEVALHAGYLPLGLNVLGSYLRGRDKQDWMDMMPRLRNDLDGKIEKTLIVSYIGLNNKKDEAIFRHIACLFNGEKVDDIKLLLADSNLDVNAGFKNLVDKSLVHVREDTVEMHRLLQQMGKEIVRRQSDEPGQREFLVDSKDICDVLEDNTGTKKVLGISLNIDEIDEVIVHENAFKGMRNLKFLEIYSKKHYTLEKEVKLQLPESFDHLPPKLKLLSWYEYPMRCMPYKFSPESLVKLDMENSKLEKLWEGVASLICLKNMNLYGSHNLKEIPDLLMATNLETLYLAKCESLVELPSSIKNLNKLTELVMKYCKKLEILPTGINLKSLDFLDLSHCLQLRIFTEISTNISVLNLEGTCIKKFPSNLHLENLFDFRMGNIESDDKPWERVQPLTPFMPMLLFEAMLSPSLTTLVLSYVSSLVELSSSFHNLNTLRVLNICYCINLETLPTGINPKSLNYLDLDGCSGLKSFPDISTNISSLYLRKTGIQEVPCWIENFSRLKTLYMESCSKLEYVHPNISKLKHLEDVDFSYCGALTGADLSGYPSGMAMEPDDIDKVNINFSNCFNLDQDDLLQQQSFFRQLIILSGEEVPSYFTHRTTGSSSSLTNISLLHTSLSQTFFRFRVCAVGNYGVEFQVNCRFKGTFGNVFDSFGQPNRFWATNEDSHYLFIWDCCIPLNKDNVQLNYDHVDMQLHVSDDSDSKFKLEGWGIRLLEDYSSADNQFDNPNVLPHVCQAHEDNMVNVGGHEIEQGEEREDSDEETDIEAN